jgi:hypothetical protein
MKYFTIGPEVAGGWGEHTVADTSVHPPKVSHLHYEFHGWLGDDIVESFPCLVVTQRLADLLPPTLTGFELAELEVSTSDQFRQLHPGRDLPAFRWLKVYGTAGVDDFGVAEDLRFVVSEAVMNILRQVSTANCEAAEWKAPQPPAGDVQGAPPEE